MDWSLQKDENVEDPQLEDINTLGTVARILRVLKMPDGNTTVIIQGKKRFKVDKLIQKKPFLTASISAVEETRPAKKNKEFKAIIDSIKELALDIIKDSPNIRAKPLLPFVISRAVLF